MVLGIAAFKISVLKSFCWKAHEEKINLGTFHHQKEKILFPLFVRTNRGYYKDVKLGRRNKGRDFPIKGKTYY